MGRLAGRARPPLVVAGSALEAEPVAQPDLFTAAPAPAASGEGLVGRWWRAPRTRPNASCWAGLPLPMTTSGDCWTPIGGCTSRAQVAGDDAGANQFLAPGHPLLEALINQVLDDLGPALREGMALEDARSAGDYLLVTTNRAGHPETCRWEPGAGCTPAATDAALDLVPAAHRDAAWSSALLRSAAKVLAVAAVRGTATPQECPRI